MCGECASCTSKISYGYAYYEFYIPVSLHTRRLPYEVCLMLGSVLLPSQGLGGDGEACGGLSCMLLVSKLDVVVVQSVVGCSSLLRIFYSFIEHFK